MGIIYRISFPECTDKVYIGQTSRTLEKRIREHVYKSAYLDEDEGCWMLNRKIKNHKNHMKVDIIFECDNDELDLWEEFYIDDMNTLYPSGLNLTSGGKTTKLSEASRQKISQKCRKYNIELGLPIHVHRCVESTGEGFIVSVPEYKKKQFCNDNIGNIDNKRALAIEYLQQIKDGLIAKKIKKIYPTYLIKTQQDGKSCFEVNVPGYKIERCFFTEANKDEQYVHALAYLESAKNGTAPKRGKLRKNPLFDGPDMEHIQDKKGGAIVHYLNGEGKQKTKSFTRSEFTVLENIQKAKEFRNLIYNR